MKYRNRIIAVLMGTTMALSSVLPVMASDNNVAVTTVENLDISQKQWGLRLSRMYVSAGICSRI